MNTDNRIIELLTDMLQEQKKTNERLDKLEKQQAKTNMELSDMRLAFIKFADKFSLFTVFEDRLSKLEKAVFQN
ncbi:MAG: hypothetical protein M1419_00825 [Bacteroidetes bacterium]|nr:hypothetical protein [Bacteroidota bacterium]